MVTRIDLHLDLYSTILPFGYQLWTCLLAHTSITTQSVTQHADAAGKQP